MLRVDSGFGLDVWEGLEAGGVAIPESENAHCIDEGVENPVL